MKRKILIIAAFAGVLFMSSANAQNATTKKKTSKNQTEEKTVSADSSIKTETPQASTIYTPSTDSLQSLNTPPPAPAPVKKQNLNIQRGINFGNHTGMGSDTSATTKDKSY